MKTRSAALLALLSLAASPVHAAWTPHGVPLCTEPNTQNSPSIVHDGASGAIVVWADSRFLGSNIYAQRIDSTGTPLWSLDGVPVCSAPNSQVGPFASPGYGSGALVVWEDLRIGNNGDIYAQRLDGNGVGQWAFNGILISTSSNDARAPRALPDNIAGGFETPGWIVVWRAEPNSDDHEFRAQHVNTSGTGSWPFGGAQLSGGGVPLRTPAMATDGAGGLFAPKGAVVVWDQYNGSPTGYDVRANRVSGSGAVQWGGVTGVSICALMGSQTDPDIVAVSGGNVIVTWGDGRDLVNDIYAQKLNSAGAAQWLDDGLPVCRASGAQHAPKLTIDGAGGVIAVWQDNRSGVLKIFAQRLDGNGLPLWTVDGIPLCTAAGVQSSPAIVTDASGGAIVVWEDRRSGTEDLYAQRVDGNGNLLWPSDGVPVSLAAQDQRFAQLTSDGTHGAIAGWYDTRAGNGDIYANRILASGYMVDVPGEVSPRRLRLAFVSSHPARGEVRLRLELPEAALVRAEVLDAQGRRVRLLNAGSHHDAGAHVLAWNGTDDAGHPVAAGLYFARVRAGAEALATRIVRLR